MRNRMLVWFSCGGPSAVAAKAAIDNHAHEYEVIVVNCNTKSSENHDNYRFFQEVQNWIGQPIIEIQNKEYKDVDDVFERTKYMSGIRGARCTTELKKMPRLEFARPDDIHVFGFTSDEKANRRPDFEARNPDLKLYWILMELGWSRQDCIDKLREVGIRQPLMYELGFDNNNCPGCVKSKGKWYWDMIRTHFPEVFKRRCIQSRNIGCRLVEVNGKRIFLDELPVGPFPKPRRKENLSCGPECGIQLKEKAPSVRTERGLGVSRDLWD